MIAPYWQSSGGQITLYHGDCLEVIPQLGQTFDAVVTDPPYGITNWKWDVHLDLPEFWAVIRPVVSPVAPIAVFGFEPFSTRLRMACMDWYKYDWVWVKHIPTGFLMAKNMPLKNYELVSIFSPGVVNHKNLSNNRMRYNPTDLIRPEKAQLHRKEEKRSEGISRKNQHEYYTIYTGYPRMAFQFGRTEGDDGHLLRLHPSQKPVGLLSKLVLTYTDAGGLVLDCFAGSGTTGVACIQTGRRCVLIEKDEHYCEVAARRLQNEPPPLPFKEG